MPRRPLILSLCLLLLLALFLAGCSAPTAPTSQSAVPSKEEVKTTAAPAAVESTKAPEATTSPSQAPAATEAPKSTQDTALSTTTPLAPAPSITESVPDKATSPTPIVESRLVELEYPASLRLGDSDIVRLALIPYSEGYVVQAEFPEHDIVTKTIHVPRPGGYDLSAIARLDGVGFDLSPEGDQEQSLPPSDPATWRWSLTPRAAGQQRLLVALTLRWTPVDTAAGTERRVTIYSRGLEINVLSFFGLTRTQAMAGGFLSLFFGGGLGLVALVTGGRGPRKVLQTVAPNPTLMLEPRPGLSLAAHERDLLGALFQRYARLTLESEFLSGYSGARTFLALPIRPDGRADAYTIVKIGQRASVEREFQNYETFVKDTLPPVTARIQHPPVVLPGRWGGEGRAALQYTFIGAPGHQPKSLRLALLESGDPALLDKLFETFGPNWWMQRRPHTFRLAQEYDRMLPAHLVLEPASGRSAALDGTTPAAGVSVNAGELVTLRGFRQIEPYPDGHSLALRGESAPGQPPIRIRWQSTADPNGATGRVTATRFDLLRGFVSGLDLLGLPDPLERLPSLLNETVRGAQSTIHGDLNLENILVGPGGFVWLIDFAQTRDGHPLYDFAHLQADIIAHVVAPQVASPFDYLAQLPQHPLFLALEAIAAKCLFNPHQPREYHLALCVTCLGALKYTNLDAHARHLLYLTAADTAKNFL